MNSDFSRAKAGDAAWTIQRGWGTITGIGESSGNYNYPVSIGDETYTIDGKVKSFDAFPSAFLVPPAEFLQMTEFKKGDRVLVKNEFGKELPRYFSHHTPDPTHPFVCFVDGADEWSSDGEVSYWKYCRKWEE